MTYQPLSIHGCMVFEMRIPDVRRRRAMAQRATGSATTFQNIVAAHGRVFVLVATIVVVYLR